MGLWRRASSGGDVVYLGGRSTFDLEAEGRVFRRGRLWYESAETYDCDAKSFW